MPRRDLTIDDVCVAMALQAERPEAQTYKAVERLALETCGYRLLTILKVIESDAVVERVSSSDEKAYPVGGRKPLDKLSASQRALDAGAVFLAADKEQVRAAFFDHELIFSLGITAIMNVPIRHSGARLGMINFCGDEGTYGEREQAIGRVLAGLLVPALLVAVGG
jgi:hypothetical protein